jgi:hypothetical protein
MFRIISLCALVTIATVAFGADDPPMGAIDMTTPLLDWDDHPIKDAFQSTQEDPTCTKCDDLSLGMAVTHAMLSVVRGDENVDGAQRWTWQELVRRVHKNKAAQLSGKEMVVIGDRLIKVYANVPNGSVIIGAAMPLIDPKRKPPELK